MQKKIKPKPSTNKLHKTKQNLNGNNKPFGGASGTSLIIKYSTENILEEPILTEKLSGEMVMLQQTSLQKATVSYLLNVGHVYK